jgi:hypothetical protein
VLPRQPSEEDGDAVAFACGERTLDRSVEVDGRLASSGLGFEPAAFLRHPALKLLLKLLSRSQHQRFARRGLRTHNFHDVLLS